VDSLRCVRLITTSLPVVEMRVLPSLSLQQLLLEHEINGLYVLSQPRQRQ
jgi:hypothetical protein